MNWKQKIPLVNISLVIIELILNSDGDMNFPCKCECALVFNGLLFSSGKNRIHSRIDWVNITGKKERESSLV